MGLGPSPLKSSQTGQSPTGRACTSPTGGMRSLHLGTRCGLLFPIGRSLMVAVLWLLARSDMVSLRGAAKRADVTGSCNAQCSHGKCSATGQCVCDAGWTGTSCDECKAGHYGNRCTACPANCTSSCDDGLAGSGLCKPHNTTSLEKCNCLHGTCNSKGGCTCSAGFTSSKTNGQLCDTCIEGFYMVGTGRCAGESKLSIPKLTTSVPVHLRNMYRQHRRQRQVPLVRQGHRQSLRAGRHRRTVPGPDSKVLQGGVSEQQHWGVPALRQWV
jgi:hypothetical protein